MAHPLALRTGYDRTRSSSFAYGCGKCSRCCTGKRIPLNPYEVARLAQKLGTSTTATLTRFTTNGGSLLAVRDDTSCVFSELGGCTVHSARPLACRLYPLGRRVGPDEEEYFAEVVPEPSCTGRHGGPGTIEDYLREQGADVYIAMADRYRSVLEKLVRTLLSRPDASECCISANDLLDRAPLPEDESLLDVDAVVARRCEVLGVAVPSELERRVTLHIAALEEIAET